MILLGIRTVCNDIFTSGAFLYSFWNERYKLKNFNTKHFARALETNMIRLFQCLCLLPSALVDSSDKDAHPSLERISAARSFHLVSVGTSTRPSTAFSWWSSPSPSPTKQLPKIGMAFGEEGGGKKQIA